MKSTLIVVLGLISTSAFLPTAYADECEAHMRSLGADPAELQQTDKDTIKKDREVVKRLDRVTGRRTKPLDEAKVAEAKKAVEPVRQTLESLNRNVLEREYVLRDLLVALIGRKNIFVIGGAGNGKSFIPDLVFNNIIFPKEMSQNFATRALVPKRSLLEKYDPNSVSDKYVSYFDRQLTGETKEAHVYGGVDVGRIMQDGSRILRLDEGLTNHVYGFLDEFLDGHLELIRALFPVLNERVYRNGKDHYQAATQTVYAATNLTLEDAYARAREANIPLESAFDRFSAIILTPKKFARRGDPSAAPDSPERFGSYVTMMDNHLTRKQGAVVPLNYLDLLKIQELKSQVEVSPYVLSMIEKIGEKMDRTLTARQAKAYKDYIEALREGRQPAPPYHKTKEYSPRMYNAVAESLVYNILLDWVMKGGNRPLQATFSDVAMVLPSMGLDGPESAELNTLIQLASDDEKEKSGFETVKIERKAFRDAWHEVVSDFEAEISRHSLAP